MHVTKWNIQRHTSWKDKQSVPHMHRCMYVVALLARLAALALAPGVKYQIHYARSLWAFCTIRLSTKAAIG